MSPGTFTIDDDGGAETTWQSARTSSSSAGAGTSTTRTSSPSWPRVTRMSVSYFHDRGGRDTVFTVDGISYRTGAAGTRCFRDIQHQFSEDAAVRTLLAAPRFLAAAERVGVKRRPQLRSGETGVSVEVLLLAGRLTAERARLVAGEYRKGSTASVDLAGNGFTPPPA